MYLGSGSAAEVILKGPGFLSALGWLLVEIVPLGVDITDDVDELEGAVSEDLVRAIDIAGTFGLRCPTEGVVLGKLPLVIAAVDGVADKGETPEEADMPLGRGGGASGGGGVRITGVPDGCD